MAKYTIDAELHAKALEELRVQWRRKSPRVPQSFIDQAAESTFAHAWTCATGHHEELRPKQIPLNLPEAPAGLSGKALESLEQMRKKMLENRQKTFEMIKQNHRDALITFFTMDNGLSRATAEEVVDKHILVHE